MKRLFVIILAALHIAIIDAITKEFAVHYLKGAPSVVVIPDFFNLTYVENRGCAWGMLQGQVWPLALFAILVLALLLWRRKDFFFLEGVRWRVRTSLCAEILLYSGILGNLIDRVARGYVVDFFDFHWAESYHFPCFNVADVCISVAATLLIFLSFFEQKAKKNIDDGRT